MPCDSIILQSVDLDLANADILRAAVQSHLGGHFFSKYSFMVDGERYSIRNGKLEGDERYVGQMADRLKQAYSREVVTRAAQRFGWRTQQRGIKLTLKRGS